LLGKQGTLPRIADFVHGADGLGNTFQAKPKGFKSEIKASDFLIQKVAEFPNEVTVVALGPLTNIAEVRPPVANLGHTVFC
jgi:uridine nucleosidase